MKQWDNTQEWNEKTIGEQYNNAINYYSSTDLNWSMYNGNQWVGINARELPKMTMPICQQAIDYLISSILSRPLRAEYNADNIPEPPPPPKEGEPPESPEYTRDRQIRQTIRNLTLSADMKWEKEKMPSKLRSLLLDAANSGDMCAHVYWDARVNTRQNETGDFKTELIDGANVMFGNPNTQETECQPYILIVGRDIVSRLKKEAKDNKVSKELIERIMSDEDTEYQIGERGKVELEGGDENSKKATYVIKYWRDEESGHIFWNKSTRYCPIRRTVDTGLTRYPIVWNNWRTVKHSYHGNSAIGAIIDNQIAINQMFAMVVYWMRQQAFGKIIIDSSRITSWSNKIGEVIKADGNVDSIVKQLESGNFNSAILDVINLAIKYTKDFIGANEAALGQINPEQASGTAIMMTAKQAAIPHENILAHLEQFVEDLYLVWGEFYLKKYDSRTLYFSNAKNKTDAFSYNSADLADVLLSCKVNVGPSTIWSETLLLQNLDNLLARQAISAKQYFERIAPLNIMPDVQGLIADARLKEMQAAKEAEFQKQLALMQGQAPKPAQGANPNNTPELQGSMGLMAQNNLRTSQPKQGL